MFHLLMVFSHGKGLIEVALSYDYLVDNLRRELPPEPEIESPLEKVREFSQLLLIVPVIIAMIFGCGQIALFTTSSTAFANTRSSLEAEYNPWTFLELPAVRPEIVNEIMADQDPDLDLSQKFSDPIELVEVWVDESSPTDGSVALAPTETLSVEAGGPGATATESSGGSPPTLPPSTQPPGSTSPPSPTQAPGGTSIPGQTSTSSPSSTPGSGPTSTSGASATFTPPPSSTPTSPPTATSPSTNTPTPNPSATPQPTQPNYCANISWNSVSTTDYEGRGTVIKFSLLFKNNNSIAMSLTSYTISFTDNGLSLHRTKAILGDGGSRPKIVSASASSPKSCTGCPVTFVAKPGGEQEIYNMFCVSTNCVEEDPGEPQIPPGTYNFTATGTFTFNGSSTCNFNKSGSITMQ
jgi:hypothetical protein